MPRIGSEYGTLVGVTGLVGQFMSIAAGGRKVVCQLTPAGELANCPAPPSVDEACPNMPRWVYFMWQALYNMHGVHYAIVGVLTADTAYELGQTSLIVGDFSKQDSDDAALAIFLSILGSLSTVFGIGLAIKGIGTAASIGMRAGDVAKAGRVGSAGTKVPGSAAEASPTVVQPGANQPHVQPNSDRDPDAIEVAPPPTGGNNGGNTGAGSEAIIPVFTKPDKKNPRISDSGWIGNAGFVAPGVLCGIPEAKILMDGAAVTTYMKNHSLIIQDTNDRLMTFDVGDVNATNQLLDVMKGGKYVEVIWDRFLYETAIAADVISRQVNNIWLGGAGCVDEIFFLRKQARLIRCRYNVHVSYTFLDDDEVSSKCQALTEMAPNTTQYCADKGVYWMSALKTSRNPPLTAPQGFDKMPTYGIDQWWPTAGSAKAYRALNPDPYANPPTIMPKDDLAFSKYVEDWASNNTYDLLELIGTTPGTWTLPVCDQGRNFWTYDWSNSGGYQPPSLSGYVPWPCACGYKGTGTKAFWDVMQFGINDLESVVSLCALQLMNIDPYLEEREENIGYNAIVGGKPDTIIYGDCKECTLTAPATLPTKLCRSGAGGCTNYPEGMAPGDQCKPAIVCKE
ncbi:uncharacterized protein KY384_008335 [Bacidia gigantensis]|uniref:uncharacterized protein n=1 Tax=Bacidia gigantensis TaxID=2732470 RepID=UPI001D03FBBC|nr:uncharacterized protein KY384_008335 [Bacidia gigantensis]KAG8526906.1 hypothetical protein KY384_008335 [Bacidia gigantensis]